MRRHLKEPIAPLPAGATCSAFRQVDLSQVNNKARSCLAHVGDAKWTVEGLVDNNNATASPVPPTPAARADRDACISCVAAVVEGSS